MSGIQDAAAGTASRRAVVGGVVGLGVGVPLLGACGSGGSSGASTPPSGPFAKTSEVPVAGGRIYRTEKVVVTQPTEGEFKAFSSICTHQGCPVARITGREIECTCHGSRFSVADGSVTNGPATKALPAFTVTVSGEDISVS